MDIRYFRFWTIARRQISKLLQLGCGRGRERTERRNGVRGTGYGRRRSEEVTDTAVNCLCQTSREHNPANCPRKRPIRPSVVVRTAVKGLDRYVQNERVASPSRLHHHMVGTRWGRGGSTTSAEKGPRLHRSSASFAIQTLGNTYTWRFHGSTW